MRWQAQSRRQRKNNMVSPRRDGKGRYHVALRAFVITLCDEQREKLPVDGSGDAPNLVWLTIGSSTTSSRTGLRLRTIKWGYRPFLVFVGFVFFFLPATSQSPTNQPIILSLFSQKLSLSYVVYSNLLLHGQVHFLHQYYYCEKNQRHVPKKFLTVKHQVVIACDHALSHGQLIKPSVLFFQNYFNLLSWIDCL